MAKMIAQICKNRRKSKGIPIHNGTYKGGGRPKAAPISQAQAELLRSPQNFSEAAGGSEKHGPPLKELRVFL